MSNQEELERTIRRLQDSLHDCAHFSEEIEKHAVIKCDSDLKTLASAAKSIALVALSNSGVAI